MIWVSFALLVLTQLILFRTPIGLRIRWVGEHPRAADTSASRSTGVRYASVILSGSSRPWAAPTSRSG